MQQIAVWHERMGMNAEEIVATYPTLTLSAVYAALSYYHSHRPVIESDIAADKQFANEMKAKSDLSKLKAKLAERHAQNNSVSPG